MDAVEEADVKDKGKVWLRRVIEGKVWNGWRSLRKERIVLGFVVLNALEEEKEEKEMP